MVVMLTNLQEKNKVWVYDVSFKVFFGLVKEY